MGGCIAGGPQGRPRQNQSIAITIQKIKLICEQQQMKRVRKLQQQQMGLLQNFHKEVPSRSVPVQKAMINRTVYYKNISQIYLICETECKVVLDRKSAIESNIRMVEQSLQILVYAASIVDEKELYNLQELLRKEREFKFPSDQDIRHQLVKYHKKTDQVTFQMENSFILEFCGKYGIEMSKVNAKGHQYGYSAGRQTFMK